MHKRLWYGAIRFQLSENKIIEKSSKREILTCHAMGNQKPNDAKELPISLKQLKVQFSSMTKRAEEIWGVKLDTQIGFNILNFQFKFKIEYVFDLLSL